VQLKVMSAIEHCRTAALGGHVAQCPDGGHSQIAYNSCLNRHCPKCQGAAAKQFLAAREADLLPRHSLSPDSEKQKRGQRKPASLLSACAKFI
jgi:hypothetical protein